MPVRGPRTVALVATGVFAMAMALAGAVPAQAVTENIFGTVSAAGGGGLDDLTVNVEQSGVVVASVSTVGGGGFSTTVDDGTYDLFIDGGDHYSDAFFAGVVVDANDASSGDFGSTVLDPGRKIRGVVRDAATGLGLPDIAVQAFGIGGGGTFEPARGATDLSGGYAITVPVDDEDDYLVGAFDSDYYPQFWDHLLFPSPTPCGCGFDGTLHVDGPGDPFNGTDFDLHGFETSIYFSVFAQKSNGDEYPGVTIFLEKNTGTLTHPSWVVVDHQLTDVTGLVDLFGSGDGDYRLRYKKGATTLAVTLAQEAPCGCGGGGTVFPLADHGKKVKLFGLVTAATTGQQPSSLDVDLTFKKATTHSTPAGPTAHPRTGTAPTSDTPVVPPTPTPEPTSPPSPLPTVIDNPPTAPGPASSPTPAPVPTAYVDLWWVWLLIALLALGIVITVIVLIRRR